MEQEEGKKKGEGTLEGQCRRDTEGRTGKRESEGKWKGRKSKGIWVRYAPNIGPQ